MPKEYKKVLELKRVEEAELPGLMRDFNFNLSLEKRQSRPWLTGSNLLFCLQRQKSRQKSAALPAIRYMFFGGFANSPRKAWLRHAKPTTPKNIPLIGGLKGERQKTY